MKRPPLNIALRSYLCLTACVTAGTLWAADTPVTREEYDKLLQELNTIKARLQQQSSTQKEQAEVLDATFDEYDQQFSSLNTALNSLTPGTTKNLISGYAYAGYTDQKGNGSSFNAGFNPIFLWKQGDRFLFESELELEYASGGDHNATELSLEYAHITYLVNDYLTIGAGQFLSPFGIFRERLHPAWINKLPDMPHAFGHEGLVPSAQLGIQARGGAPIGSTKINYTVWLANGPTLNTGQEKPEETGVLHFNNYDSFDESKAVGARVGFLPIPQLELGYSFQYSRMKAERASGDWADGWLHGVYLAYLRDSDALKGTLDLKGEWMWSTVSKLTYDPDGSLGFGALLFDNSRNGGYVQLAYRPSKAPWKCLQPLELVGRYDRVELPEHAPMSGTTDRGTIGINYWFHPSAVFKAAYQFGEQNAGAEENHHISAFLVQAALGF